MGSSSTLRPGQRVRIRPTSESEFAGCYGVVIYVGNTVCDVRIRLKRRRSRVYETHIRTFSKDDLETLHRKVDLVYYTDGTHSRPFSGWYWLCVGFGVFLVAVVTIFHVI